MANTLLTIQMITNEALAVLENELTFTKGVNRQYDDSFGQSGAKIGTTLNIRKPPQYVGRTGQAIAIENATETSVPLTLTTQRGVDISFSSQDLKLNIDDFSDRFIKPAMANVANGIDVDGLTMAINNTYNSVGTPGTPLADGTTLLTSGALLDACSTPRGKNMRSAVFGPFSAANVIGGLKSIFNSPAAISEQYNTGNLGSLYGYKTSMDQNVLNRTVGNYTGSTPTVNGAGQSGSSIVTAGWTASTTVLNVGDIITFAGVYGVNVQSKTSTNQLQQFAVTAPVTSSSGGAATISISPAIVLAGTGFQNVTAAPAAGAAIVVSGAANTVTTQNLAYHRDAFTLACADLPLPGGVDMAARQSDPQTGLSVRLVRAYNITTDQFPCRLDVLYGWAPLYPQWACRIQA